MAISDPTNADFAAHVDFYRSFLRTVRIAVVGLVVLLSLMAYFLV